MSHKRRFFTPTELKGSKEIIIEGEEARHAIRVLRIKEGAKVSIINGKGEEASGIIKKSEKERLFVEFLEEVKIFNPPKIKIYLLIGMAEISALEEALLHCAELGLWRFCPVFTKYSLTKPEQIERKLERLQKIAISGIKQSGFPFLPEIVVFKELKTALNSLSKKGFFFSQDARNYLSDFEDFQGEITFAIGPEGDFSEEEKNLFEEFGYKKAKLSENTLRVETAAITAMAQMQDKLSL